MTDDATEVDPDADVQIDKFGWGDDELVLVYSPGDPGSEDELGPVVEPEPEPAGAELMAVDDL